MKSKLLQAEQIFPHNYKTQQFGVLNDNNLDR